MILIIKKARPKVIEQTLVFEGYDSTIKPQQSKTTVFWINLILNIWIIYLINFYQFKSRDNESNSVSFIYNNGKYDT